MAAKEKSKKVPLTARFKFKRSTKGTHVYEEVDTSGNPIRELVGSIYVQRSAIKEPPEFITVTIDP